MSTVVLYELTIGAYLSDNPKRQLEKIRELIRVFEVAPFVESDAAVAAHLGSALKRTGHSIGVLDTLIAGQALNRGWTVVTANARHFSLIPGLAVEDWSRPVEPPGQ